MVVGIDLGKYSIQISYFRTGMDEPATAEQVIGSRIFNIPMVLCKRTGVNQWFYGREALKRHERGEGHLVDSILQKAIDGERELVEGEEIEGVALLTLFVKRSLSILGGAHVSGTISDVMFTCEDLSPAVIDVMGRVSEGLQLKDCNVYFQSYAESIYHYMIHQDETLWKQAVLCSYYDGIKVVDYSFHRNLRTTPIVAFVDTLPAYSMPMPQIITEDSRKAAYERLDKEYSAHISGVLNGEDYSGVYLLGDGFKDEWYTESVKILARNRRVFVGNDLFSRGACYSLQDKYTPDKNATSHVFLGADKLKSNVGMEVLRRGSKSYLALLDAGINWYDVGCEYEMFVNSTGKIDFTIIPLAGGEHVTRSIELFNLPERDEDTLRVKLSMSMSDVRSVNIHIEDLGFGEMFPSSGMEWDYTLEV